MRNAFAFRIEILGHSRCASIALALVSKPVRYFAWVRPGAFGAGAGGADRIRTDDPLLAKQVLSQLSYSPLVSSARTTSQTIDRRKMVGQGGFEPPTSRLSSARSNQLSY